MCIVALMEVSGKSGVGQFVKCRATHAVFTAQGWPPSASFKIANIWLSVNFDFFMQNLLGKSYEKILLSTSINSRGDYLRPSMSRKGNCWDNAAMESFFARLKVESIYAEDVNNKQDAYSCVFEYIEMFYNSTRRHSSNGYVSPAKYENEYYDKCA